MPAGEHIWLKPSKGAATNACAIGLTRLDAVRALLNASIVATLLHTQNHAGQSVIK